MLPDTIQLPVDPANNGTIANLVYTRYDEFQNRSVYNATGHTLAARDTLTFYRSPVKASGNFAGTAKSSSKLSKDYSVPGINSSTSITAPAIVEVSTSFPVGLTTAQMMEMRQRAIALIDHAIYARLSDTLEV